MVKTIQHFPSGIVTLPPSKSMAHRAVICAALANGVSNLHNIALSNDIRATLTCMQQLGATVTAQDTIYHMGGITQPTASATLDCGESGSTLRFLIPIAAALGTSVTFCGQGRLLQRPMTAFISPLQAHGVTLVQDNEGIRVSGKLQSGVYHLPGNVSSQFVSGFLMALPLLAEGGEVVVEGQLESASYVDLTIDVLAQFGVTVTREGNTRFSVAGGQQYQPQAYAVEADYSQSAFFLVAAALGRPVTCLGLSMHSKQGDMAILSLLERCGATITTAANGGITVTATHLTGCTIDVTNIPDLVPPLAVLLSFCEGESHITGAARLRLKESDRLAAMTSELTKLGARITCSEDALHIQGVKRLQGGTVDAWGDHRIAMAMAVAAIGCDAPVILHGSDTVAKSYPSFWDDFEGSGRTS